MLSRRRTPRGVVAAGLVGAVLAGCGSSTAGPRPATPPSGFTVYRDAGFSVSVPAGYRAHSETIGGAPAGTHTVRLSPGGTSLDAANTDILLSHSAHLTASLQTLADNLRKADLADPQLGQIRVSVAPASVTGARSALLVRDTFVSPYALRGRARGRFERTWLMVATRKGGLVEIVVVREPQRGATLDPSKVIGSVRLSG